MSFLKKIIESFMRRMDIEQKQKILFGVLILLLFGLITFIAYYFVGDDLYENIEHPEKDTHISAASQQIKPQEVWVEKIENETDKLTKKITDLEIALKNSVESNHRHDAQIEDLKEQLTGKNLVDLEEPEDKDTPHTLLEGGSLVLPEKMSSLSSGLNETVNGEIHKIVLNLAPLKSQDSERKTVENTIPAGAYASAILIGGVDASTSVSAQSDPRPVLLRLTDHGTLPRRFKSDLKDCHVLASSYGDISSERVYMRLEKLTCTEPLTGEIIETEVSGYISGEDGKAGVRGVVVDRAGEALRSSFVAGFLGGMSNYFGALEQRSVFPVSPFGQTSALGVDKMLGSSAAQGSGQAMDKFAEFYIKRAEQLQPVLQIAAGRNVDIIFTQGTKVGGSTVRQAIHRVREESRKSVVSQLESSQDSKEWLPQVTDSNLSDTQ